MYPDDQARILRNSTENEKKKEIEEEKEEERRRLAFVLEENCKNAEFATEDMYEERLNLPDRQDNNISDSQAQMLDKIKSGPGLVDNEEDDSNYESEEWDSSESQRSDEGMDLTPAQKIDLWKKLQDLMRN